jgi:ABC-type multidrug transport system ATPase subunit
MDEVARCDRAAFVFDGKKLSEDTPERLASSFSGRIFYLDREPSVKLVNRLNEIDGLSAQRFGAGLHLYLGASDQLDNYASPLSEAGVEKDDLSEIGPDLEDRFIQLMETKG